MRIIISKTDTIKKNKKIFLLHKIKGKIQSLKTLTFFREKRANYFLKKQF